MPNALSAVLRDKSRAVRASTRALHHAAVQRVIEAFRANLEQPLDLQNMAKIAVASPFHFNRTFREVAGIPPCQFLYALRLETAGQLLISSNRSVLDICYEVGYNSLGTFTRRFTEVMGLSPTRFRAMAKSMEAEEFRKVLKHSQDVAKHLPEDVGMELTGRVETPADFEGIVMVGLFETAIPQGKPVTGTLAVQGEPYAVPRVPDGTFHLFAAGLPLGDDPVSCFHNQKLLRGGGQAVTVQAGVVTGTTDVVLRQPEVTDPPILVTLPLLLQQFLGGIASTEPTHEHARSAAQGA